MNNRNSLTCLLQWENCKSAKLHLAVTHSYKHSLYRGHRLHGRHCATTTVAKDFWCFPTNLVGSGLGISKPRQELQFQLRST